MDILRWYWLVKNHSHVSNIHNILRYSLSKADNTRSSFLSYSLIWIIDIGFKLQIINIFFALIWIIYIHDFLGSEKIFWGTYYTRTFYFVIKSCIQIFKNFIGKNKNSFEGIFISEMKCCSKIKRFLLQRNSIFFDRMEKRIRVLAKYIFTKHNNPRESEKLILYTHITKRAIFSTFLFHFFFIVCTCTHKRYSPQGSDNLLAMLAIRWLRDFPLVVADISSWSYCVSCIRTTAASAPRNTSVTAPVQRSIYDSYLNWEFAYSDNGSRATFTL